MTLLERHKKAFSEKPKVEDTEMLLVALNQMYHELDGETSDRIGRYREYNNFFHGDQWYRLDRKSDRHAYTVNYCEPIVTKYASLLVGDAPIISVPRESETEVRYDVGGYQGYGEEVPDFDSEENRSELLEKVLRKIVYRDNAGGSILYEGAKGGSLYGDTVFYLDYDEKKQSFKMQNVFPGYVRAAFATDDYTELDYVIVQRIVSVDYVMRKYGVEVPADSTEDLAGTDLVWDSRMHQEDKFVILKTYFDNEVKITFVTSQILAKKEHKYPRLPFFFIPNRVDSYNPWGMSDLKDVIEIQERLNLAVSNQADIIELFANPKIIGRNLTQRDVEAIKKATGNVIPLRRDADLQPFQFQGQIYPMREEIADARQAIHDVSGLPPVFFGQAQGSIVTGVALTAQAAPTLQIVNAKSLLWVQTLEKMMSFMLEVLEKKNATFKSGGQKHKLKDFINGVYEVEVQTNIRTPRDDAAFIQNEANKVNFRLQSRTTAMTNLGVESPDDELKRIAWEEINPLYTPNPERLQNEMLHTPSGMDEVAQEAFQDVERLSQGEQVPVQVNSVEAAKLKLEVADRYARENQVTQDPSVAQVFDAYMSELEQYIANAQGAPFKIPKGQGPQATPVPGGVPGVAQQNPGQPLPNGGASPLGGGEVGGL